METALVFIVPCKLNKTFSAKQFTIDLPLPLLLLRPAPLVVVVVVPFGHGPF